MCIQESDGYLKGPFFIYEKKFFSPERFLQLFKKLQEYPFLWEETS